MFGWTYDYLLWGISWMNVQTMLADAPKPEKVKNDESGKNKVVHRELKTKEDIKNYVKGII